MFRGHLKQLSNKKKRLFVFCFGMFLFDADLSLCHLRLSFNYLIASFSF